MTTLSVKPSRWFVPPDRVPQLDEYGFVRVPEAEGFHVDDLLALRAVLVTAPPWTGKTHVLRQTFSFLRSIPDSDASSFGRFIHLTEFHKGNEASNSVPAWWEEWRVSTSRACWIVDAADDDERRNTGAVHKFLDRIRSLGEGERDRLCFLISCRQSEVPESLRPALDQTFSPDDCRELKLAPLTILEAKQLVGEAFSAVCGTIAKHRLQHIANLPCVLKAIVGLNNRDELSERDVWKYLLTNMLINRGDPPDAESRFLPVCTLAASLMLAQQPELDASFGQPNNLTVSRLFPAAVIGESLAATRCRFASDALKTAVFRRTGTGFAFIERHVQEWFAAFALADFPLRRLKGVLTNREKQPVSTLRGVQGILCSISSCPDVRDYLFKLHGGIPHSDHAPWSLDQVRVAVDKWVKLAGRSEHGLSILRLPGLERLRVPRVGSVLREQLARSDLNDTQLRFLLDLSFRLKAAETVDQAIQLALAPDRSADARRHAVHLIGEVGVDQEVRLLVPLVGALRSTEVADRRLVATIVSTLFRREYLTFRDAVLACPQERVGELDEAGGLRHELLIKMSADDAYWLIRVASGQERAALVPHGDCFVPSHEFIRRALKTILATDILRFDDLRQFLCSDYSHWDVHHEIRLVLQRITSNPDWRRQLFNAGLALVPDCQSKLPWVCELTLLPEDLEWLLGRAKELGATIPWLWSHTLMLAYQPGVTDEDRVKIREAVGRYTESAIANFDENRIKRENFQKAMVERAEQAEQADRANTVTLERVVSSILLNIEPQAEKMRKLSWHCFASEYLRPSGVIGAFEELPADLKSSVLRTCEHGLADATPTPIPNENHYSSDILCEAYAFQRVLDASLTYPASGSEIRKWLTAVLLFCHDNSHRVLERCRDVDVVATEEAIARAVQRDLKVWTEGSFVASNLPSEYWTNTLAKSLADLVSTDDYRVSSRAGLLTSIALRAPDVALPVVRDWLHPVDAVDGRLRRSTAINLLCVLGRAEECISEVEIESRDDSRFILSLSAFRRSRQLPSNRFDDWAANTLATLCTLLHQAVPPESDPSDQFGVAAWGEKDDDFRWLRRGIPELLFARDGPGDRDVLGTLANEFEEVRSYFDSARANEEAALVAARRELPMDSSALPIEDAVRLLNDGMHRVIRSADDLHDLLIEELEEIGSTAKEHLSMLYRPKPRERRASKKKRQNGKFRQPLEEAALQAYVYCRLVDRLRQRTSIKPEVQMGIYREPLAAANQRLDIRVDSWSVSGEPVGVIVEIKWSTDRTVSRNLRKQLVDDYLANTSLRNGIYLVGWCGRGSWPGTRYRTRSEWKSALIRQARAVLKSPPHLRVTPVLIDLSWPAARDSKRNTRKRRRGSS